MNMKKNSMKILLMMEIQHNQDNIKPMTVNMKLIIKTMNITMIIKQMNIFQFNEIDSQNNANGNHNIF